MNLATNHVFAPDEEVKLLRNLDQAKFKNYAKEKFSGYVKDKLDLIDYQKIAKLHYSLHLPEEINELFISFRHAPFFWFTNSPILFRTEHYLKKHEDNFSLFNSYWDVKKYYDKWVKLKNPKDKEYFALSVHKILQRNLEHFDFLSLILYSVILAYENSFATLDVALNVINKAQNDIFKLDMNDRLKRELLYVTSIFAGYYFLLKEDYESAVNRFKESKNYKTNPITAIFYQGLAYQKLGLTNELFENLREIFEYDKLRFQFALDVCSEGFFNYFFSNAIVYQIFNESAFSSALEDIKLLIESSQAENKALISTVYQRVLELKDQKDDEDCSLELVREIDFLKNLLERFHRSRNLLFIYSAPLIKVKFNNLINKIENFFNAYYSEKINKSISGHDVQISQTQQKLEQIEAEKRNIEIKTNQKLVDSINNINKFYNEQLELIENRIKNLPSEGKFNPTNVFKDIMIFATLIAVMIFVIGGFASGLSQNTGLGEASNGVINTIFSAGLKWGGITFLVGIFIAMFSAASAVMDKSSFHQKLVKEMSRLKALKEEEIKRVKIELENMKKSALRMFEKKEALFKEDLNKFLDEKNEKLEKLQIEAQIEMEEKLKNIKRLFIS